MNEIRLNHLKLKIFTEQDAKDYCKLNNINTDNITELNLYDNKLTDISVLKNLKDLEILSINGN